MKVYLSCLIFISLFTSQVFAEARVNDMCRPLSKQMNWHSGDTVYWETHVIPDYEQTVASSRSHATKNSTFKSSLASYGYSIDKINEHNSLRLKQECDLNHLSNSNACHHFKAYCLNDMTTNTLYKSFDSFNKCALNRQPWCGESFNTPEGIRANLNTLTNVYNQIAKTQQAIIDDPTLSEYFGDVQQSFDELKAKLEEAKRSANNSIADLNQEIKDKYDRMKKEDARFNNACSIMDQCNDYITEKGYDDDYQIINQTAFCRIDNHFTPSELEPLENLLKGLNGQEEKKQLQTLAINSLENSTAQTVKEWATIYKGLYGTKPSGAQMCKDLPRFCKNELAQRTLEQLSLNDVARLDIPKEIKTYNQAVTNINELCGQASSIGINEEISKKINQELYSVMTETKMGQLMGVKHFRDKVPPFNQEACFEDGVGFEPINEGTEGTDLVHEGIKGIIKLQKDKSDQLSDQKNQVTYAGKWTSPNDSDYFEILQDIVRNDPYMVREVIKQSGDPNQALWICKATHEVYRTRRTKNIIAGVGTGLAIAGALAATVFTFGAATPLLFASVAMATGVGVYHLDEAITARHNAEKSIAINSADLNLLLQELPNLDTQVKMAYAEIGMSLLPGAIKGVSVAGKTIGPILKSSKLIASAPGISKLTGPSKILMETIQKGGKVSEKMIQKALASKLGQANPKVMASFIELTKDMAPDVALEVTTMAAVYPDPPGPFSEEGLALLAQSVAFSYGFNRIGMSGKQYILKKQAKRNLALSNSIVTSPSTLSPSRILETPVPKLENLGNAELKLIANKTPQLTKGEIQVQKMKADVKAELPNNGHNLPQVKAIEIPVETNGMVKKTLDKHGNRKGEIDFGTTKKKVSYEIDDPQLKKFEIDYQLHLKKLKNYKTEVPRNKSFSKETNDLLNQLENELEEIVKLGPVQKERVYAAMNSLKYSVNKVDEAVYVDKVVKKLFNLKKQNVTVIKVKTPEMAQSQNLDVKKYNNMIELEGDFDLLTRKASSVDDPTIMHEVDTALLSKGIPKNTFKTGTDGHLEIENPYRGDKVYAIGYKGAINFKGKNSNTGGERYYGLVYEKGFVQKFGADLRNPANLKHGSKNNPDAQSFNQHYGNEGKVFTIRGEKATSQQGQVHLQLSGGYTQMEINGQMTSQADWVNQFVKGVVEFDQNGNIIRFIPKE